MKANDLVTVHYDIYPTETFPGLNRSPSFIDVKDKNEGLMSVDIPRRRYSGRMIPGEVLLQDERLPPGSPY